MNKHEHAANSANIFGGKPEEYEALHALIDYNKVVSPSIFGRFFLHHTDIGLPILEKIFGKTVGSKKARVRHLLMQHLFEDYGLLLTFKRHWEPALQESKELPKPDHWEHFIEKARKDSRIKKLKDDQLKELETFFRLKAILPLGTSFSRDVEFAIFGHALGADVLAKIIGQKFHGLWTSDVLIGYLNCRFKLVDRHRDPVPTLLDYERHIPDHPFMHAPIDYEDADRANPKRTKKLIDGHIKEEEETKVRLEKLKESRIDQPSFRRKSCNYD